MKFRPTPAPCAIGEAIFVFGSNIEGRHGKGAALTARRYFGAKGGVGEGPQGQSYAIPTRQTALFRTQKLISLRLGDIAHYVREFLTYAVDHPELTFYVTRIGCGNAGYTDQEIAPMFAGAPDNCLLPPEWKELLT